MEEHSQPSGRDKRGMLTAALLRHQFESFVFLTLFLVYLLVCYALRGGDVWWHVDFAANVNSLWGDDAYRYFVVRSAWINPDAYWFNFVLPGQLLLDGLLTTLSDDSQLLVRAYKAVAVVGVCVFTYASCLQLGVRRSVAMLATLTLGLLPLYFFVGVSFFAESWFGFFLALSVLLRLRGHDRASFMVAAVLPLLRIEGVLFVGMLSFFGLVGRDKEKVLLPVSLGTIYFFLIITIGPGLSGFLGWRQPMTEVYAQASNWYGGDLGRYWDANPWLWQVLSVSGLLLFCFRKLPEYIIAAALLTAYILISAHLKLANFEPRYLVQVMPLFPLGLAVLVERALQRFDPMLYGPSVKFVSGMLFGVIFLMHSNTLYVVGSIYQHVYKYGKLPAAVVKAPLSMSSYFKSFSSEDIKQYQELAGLVEGLAQDGEDIESIVVSDFIVFYFLRPENISPDQRIVFALFGRGRLDPILGLYRTAGYFATPPYFSQFSLTAPKDGSPQVLYVDRFSLPSYPLHWQVGEHHVFLFGGDMVTSDE